MSTPAQSENTPGLRALIREDYRANGGDWSLPGFRAAAVYRFGVWRMHVRFPPLRMLCSFLYKRMFRHVRNHYGIELYYTSKVGRRLQIAHQGGIVIHEHATIGDDCIIRQNVTIGAARLGPMIQPPIIGNRVSLGAGAVVIGSVTIGDDVIIGPNAVVMSNVPTGATVTAMPGRVIPPAKKTIESATTTSGDAGQLDSAGAADSAGTSNTTAGDASEPSPSTPTPSA